jgi:hypothetical protein
MRYVHTPEVREFLATVAATAASRTRVLGPDIDLRRAQIGGHREPMFKSDQLGQIRGPFRPERMKPIDGLAREGRVNPAGIAYLYLSSNPETAIAETRPWIGAWVSLGTFRLVRDVRIVDCTIGRRKRMPHLDEPPPAERERCVWRDINEAFARPVVTDESPTEYVPTQVLGDLFQSEGLEGIAFRSSCARGRNLVLFNTLLAGLVRCNLARVDSLRYRHVWTGAVYNLEDSRGAAPPNNR